MAARAREAARAIGAREKALPEASATSRARNDSLFDLLISDPDITSATRSLFVDGHYARAVEEAFKCLNNGVRRRSGITDKDGSDLMFHAFDPRLPVLRINRLNSVSEIDEQAGYRQILAGCMKGLRNPRAHEHQLQDNPNSALELLVLANHLMSVLKRSKKVRMSPIRIAKASERPG